VGKLESGIGNKRIYRWYLLLSIAYSSISILMGLLSSTPNFLPFTALIYPVALIWFIFSIVMLVHFREGGFETAALLIPILYIADLILSLAAGVAYFLLSLATRTPLFEIMSGTFPSILSKFLPAIIIIVCVNLLIRKEE